MNENEEVWGELVQVDLFSTPVQMSKAKIIIGRAKDCDVHLSSKLVSAHHCFLERTKPDEVWLTDTSTNGTLINQKVKVKGGSRHLLTDGDEIHLVYKKKSPELCVKFMYNEKKPEIGLDDFSQSTIIIDTSDATIPSENSSPLSSPEPQNKRVKIIVVPENDDKLHSSQTAGPSSVQPSDSSVHAKQMEETLLCSICQEIFYDCISVQPCMHCFCASCFAPWMKQSKDCPQCRKAVFQVSRNHIVNNLVDVYYQQYPMKKRSDSTIQELKAKNKEVEDVLFPKNQATNFLMAHSLDVNSETSDSDYSDAECCPPNCTHFPRIPSPLCRQCSGYRGLHSVVAVPLRPTSHASLTDVPSSFTMPSTSSAVHPPPQLAPHMQFVCRPNPTHALCSCCLEPMPDRRHERSSNGNVPPQQCSRCFRLHCHMYWGCKRPGCSGCLNKFRDFNFENSMLGTINENHYESQILMDYLRHNNVTCQDMFQECLNRLATGEFQTFPAVTADSVLCYSCGLVNFKQLVYSYRKSIPRDRLSPAVTSRPDCYWGRNCRTQKHHPNHAQKFNHVCEQVRFT